MSFYERMIVKNPVFSLGLGIGPVLALSYRFDTAWVTGVLSLVLILLSKGSVRLVKELFPSAILWYVRITILTFWVALMEIIFEAYLPGLRDSLGIYFPLLAVNTFLLEAIVFGEQGERNEWYGSLLFGLVYLGTIAFVGAFREIVGSGNLTLFVLPGWTLRYAILTKPLQPIRFFILPAGGLILYGYLKAGFRLMVTRSNRRRVEEEP
jgi:electron transport complex protein RnfE